MTMAQALMLTAADVRPIAEARRLGAIDVQHGPIGDLAVSADGSTILTTNSAADSVSVLDAGSLTLDGLVPVLGDPYAVVMAGDRAFVAAASVTSDAVSAVDASAMDFLASLPLDLNHLCAAASHGGRRLLVAGTGHECAELAIIDVESGRANRVFLDADTVDAVRVAPNGRLVYVAASDADDGCVFVVDPAKGRVVGAVPTALPIRDLELSRDGSVAYALGCDPEHGGVVETIDTTTNRVLATAWIGGFPTQFALGADGTRMYLVDVDHVAVWCTITNEVVDAITVGALPSCVVVSHDTLYVADYSGTVTAFEVPLPSFDDVIDVETLALTARELEPV